MDVIDRNTSPRPRIVLCPTIPLQNKFFITCLDSVFKYKIQELGGVRVITH